MLYLKFYLFYSIQSTTFKPDSSKVYSSNLYSHSPDLLLVYDTYPERPCDLPKYSAPYICYPHRAVVHKDYDLLFI